jgi:integrase
MGRTGSGVEVRESSIRLRFTFEGKRHAPTLMLNDEPMKPTKANIAFAHRLADEIKTKIRLKSFSMAEYFPDSGQDGGTLTVSPWLDTWLGTLSVEGSTLAGYTSAVRFWKAVVCDPKTSLALGDLTLRALRTSHIRTAIASRPALSGKTVNNYVSVLREAMAAAVDDKLLVENPVEKVPRAKHQKEPPDPFARDEMELICAEARTRYPAQVANLIETWFWTGMRTSEIFGLQWPNVDLNKDEVLVREALVRGERKDTTKTNVARLVKLNSRSRVAVQQQRAYTQISGGPVFNDPRYDLPWEEERAFRRSYWTPLLKVLGIRYRRPYNMRHTYATVMLMAGMTPAFCATQLGHSVEMFLKTYARWLDGEQNDLEMARLENALSAPVRPQEKIKGT